MLATGSTTKVVRSTVTGLRHSFGKPIPGFSDFEMTVEFMLIEDAMGVTGFTVSGTPYGEFMGIPATENVGTTPGIMVQRFEDGKVVEAWAVWDALGQLQQLGVLPKSFTLASFLETGANLAKRDVLKLEKGK